MTAVLASAACRPSTVAEAESKHDVKWLDENGTADAVAAIGRLADADSRAVAALEARSAFDGQAFVGAWEAVGRGAAWGAALMHEGLADPRRADLAAAAIEGTEGRQAAFLDDLDGALVRLGASQQNVNVASALASIGPVAHAAVVRRLADASTRTAMCRGIASPKADRDARRALLEVPESARDAGACVEAVVRIAADDDVALAWVAERGEPGLLGAAGTSALLPCPRLHWIWTKALSDRPADVYAALKVPLGYAVKRCPAEMDGVLADAIVRLPLTHGVVVDAIDPFAAYDGALHATCAALPAVAVGRDPLIVRERASDALGHACKAL
jgi:hypothetical protein